MEMLSKELISHFAFEGEYFYSEPFGCGHINSTYAVYFKFETKPVRRYIMQRINTDIFKDADALMENINGVTSFLRRKIIENGGDPERETLTIVPTADGRLYWRDAEGGCWRAYIFIENATSYQTVERPVLFSNAAAAFGRFQRLLADYPAAGLHETIPNFHNTVSRFADFKASVAADKVGRAKSVQKEIQFILDRESDYSVIVDALADGSLPLRVTHNDTKLNNIMMDNATDEAVCVIDLDTVMPGSALYDFGDSIRFGASSAAEDETDLDKVYMVPELFEAYTEGFLREAGDAMTQKELDLLAMSAKIMTVECGMRFLADYLDGDVYFRVHREGHNLDRARTQFKLVADMEQKMDMMNAIVAKHSKK